MLQHWSRLPQQRRHPSQSRPHHRDRQRRSRPMQQRRRHLAPRPQANRPPPPRRSCHLLPLPQAHRLGSKMQRHQMTAMTTSQPFCCYCSCCCCCYLPCCWRSTFASTMLVTRLRTSAGASRTRIHEWSGAMPRVSIDRSCGQKPPASLGKRNLPPSSSPRLRQTLSHRLRSSNQMK